MLAYPFFRRERHVAATEKIVDDGMAGALARFYCEGGKVEWNHFCKFAKPYPSRGSELVVRYVRVMEPNLQN